MGWLDGKRALVIGAGSGIGRAVLAAFREEGAQVAALELDKIKAERVAVELPECVVSQGDATAMADARAAVRTAAEAFGGLDVLVNNAGVFVPHQITEVSYEQWQEAWQLTLGVNLTGAANANLNTITGVVPVGGGSLALTPGSTVSAALVTGVSVALNG